MDESPERGFIFSRYLSMGVAELSEAPIISMGVAELSEAPIISMGVTELSEAPIISDHGVQIGMNSSAQILDQKLLHLVRITHHQIDLKLAL